MTDGQLLSLFWTRNDQSAFAILVARHREAVHGVCQRVLRNVQDAEDASQAAFLVLARKARSLVQATSVAGWLHQVARRTAMNLRGRRKSSRELTVEPAATPTTVSELSEAVDEELQRLPEKFREPLLLCCLEGLSRSEAAARLGVSEAAVKDRLERGRDRLRTSLLQRGVTLSAGFVALFLGGGTASACGPPTAAAVAATVQGAALYATGGSAAGVVSLNVVSIADGVLKTMLIHKMKVAVGVCLSALTMGFVAHAMLVDNPNRFEKALRGHVVEVRHGAGRTMTVTLDEFDVPLNLDVAPNAKTTLAFAASDFADVRPGMYVALRLAADHRTVSEIDVMGAVHEGRLTRYDPASRRLSIETIPDDDDAPPRTETFDVAPDVIARIDEIQGRADDLEAGQPISVELAKDGKTVNAVSARWRTESDVEAVLESYEPATRTATLFVDQEDVVVRQQIVLAKDIRLFVDGVPATESDLQPNLFLVIRMAPDQKSATAIRGRKPVVEIEDDDDDEKSDGTDDSATAEDAAESVPPERDDDFQPDVEDDA